MRNPDGFKLKIELQVIKISNHRPFEFKTQLWSKSMSREFFNKLFLTTILNYI